MRPVTRILPRSWIIALVAALALLTGDSAHRIRHADWVSGLYGVMVEPPTVDPASPTGYLLGRRTLILPDAGEDGYQWIMQTQTTLARGPWRIREVSYDNAPYGRPTQWASAFRWWMALIASVDHAISGRPLGSAVEHAALLANPLLLGLLLLGLIPVVARRFGGAAAGLLALGLVAVYPFNLYFAADYPDHHGILEACGLMTVLFLLAGGGGIVRTEGGDAVSLPESERGVHAWLPDRSSARRWFLASAVAGGVGLWVSAASEVPVLVGIGLGAVWSGWMGRASGGQPWTRDPTLWRRWGIAGATVSVVAYLVEYFPHHLGFRLEVNHPLYALAWLGGGELLCRYFRMLGGRGLGFNRRDVRAALLAAAAVAVLPVTILLTGKETFLVSNRFVWLLGTRYIAEGQSLSHFLARTGSNLFDLAQGLPLVLIAVPLPLLFSRRVARVWKTLVVLAWAPALLFLVLTWREIRWWGLEYGMLFALLAFVLAAMERAASRRTVAWGVATCGLLLLPGTVRLFREFARPRELTLQNVHRLAERDVAQWLRLRVGNAPVIVASTPATTNHLIYFGSFRGLGTFYWENTEGFKHAAAIFSASTPEAARALIRRYQVGYIVLLSWDPFADSYVRFYRNLPPDAPAPRDAFIVGLFHGRGLPPWLRPIPYPLPPNPALKGQSVLVFEVTAPQSPEAAAIHMTDYLEEMGRPELARRYEPVLAQYPDSLPALAMLAYVQGRAREANRFTATLERIIGLLPGTTTLSLEDRIRLAFVLAAGGRQNLATGQLRQCMAQLDEHRLRQLSVGSLHDLLELSERLEVPMPDPRLGRLALSLYPPFLRTAP